MDLGKVPDKEFVASLTVLKALSAAHSDGNDPERLLADNQLARCTHVSPYTASGNLHSI